MTVGELFAAVRAAGLTLSAKGDKLRVRGPATAMTPELREALTAHKGALLDLLWRLDGMRQHRDPVPTAKNAIDSPGGPGRCFSCGVPLEHPQAYGRCVPCWTALQIFNGERAEKHHPEVVA